MKRAGSGSIIFIGATASLRGMPRTAAFAPVTAAKLFLASSAQQSSSEINSHWCVNL